MIETAPITAISPRWSTMPNTSMPRPMARSSAARQIAVFLFGVLPVDYDDLTLVRVEPGRGFLEQSSLLTQRRWVHERLLEAVTGGCRVTDRIGFEPRAPFGGRAMRAVFHFFFRHRHRRLAQAFARPAA